MLLWLLAFGGFGGAMFIAGRETAHRQLGALPAGLRGEAQPQPATAPGTPEGSGELLPRRETVEPTPEAPGSADPAMMPAPAMDPAPDETLQPDTPAEENATAAAPTLAASAAPTPPRSQSPPKALRTPSSTTPAIAAAPSPTPLSGAFDRQAATAALARAATAASRCRAAEDPTGMARVAVTFSPSGQATRAVVEGAPFAGTATGSCIAEKMRTASVPEFTGGLITVLKTVVID